MEKEIKQDFTIFRPVIYTVTAVPVVLMLLGGATSLVRDHDWSTFAFVLGFSAGAFGFVWFCLRLSLARAETSPRKWFLTTDGLVRRCDSEKRATIRWEQVQDLHWGRHLGLKVGWRESKSDHRPPEFRAEFRKWQTGRYSGWLRIGEVEAREIFQLAKRDWFDMKL